MQGPALPFTSLWFRAGERLREVKSWATQRKWSFPEGQAIQTEGAVYLKRSYDREDELNEERDAGGCSWSTWSSWGRDEKLWEERETVVLSPEEETPLPDFFFLAISILLCISNIPKEAWVAIIQTLEKVAFPAESPILLSLGRQTGRGLGYYWSLEVPSNNPVSWALFSSMPRKAFLGNSSRGVFKQTNKQKTMNNSYHFYVPGIILLSELIHLIPTSLMK